MKRALENTAMEFDRAMDAADRAGVLIPNRAVTAIEAMRNSEDVVFYLAKNPDICQELLENEASATQRIGEISRELMQRAPAQAPRQQQPDQETLRHNQLLNAHLARMNALRATDPEAAKAIDAAVASNQSSGIGPSPYVYSAILDQSNSEYVARYLLTNPAELVRLNGLHPTSAITEVGRLAERLEAKAASRRERAKPPSPITPVGASSSRTGLSLDDPSVPIGTFIRERNRQEWQRKRAGR